jgi:hypothetical protein
LKCILIAQGGFALAFQTCIYCTLIRLTPSITLFSLSCSSIIQQLMVHCVVFIHRCIVSILFSPTMLFSSSPTIVPSDRPSIIIVLSLSHMWSYMYLCVVIHLASTYVGKRDFCPSEPGLLHLIWWCVHMYVHTLHTNLYL